MASRASRAPSPAAPARAHGQEAPPVTVRGALSLAHCSVHRESSLHDSEHEPAQRTSQVAPLAQVTLPLPPTVRAQSEPPAQLALHDSPHVPEHSVSSVQLNVQLAPAQSEPSRSQAVPAGHEHDEPVQAGGGGPSSPPHAATAESNNTRTSQGLTMPSP